MEGLLSELLTCVVHLSNPTTPHECGVGFKLLRVRTFHSHRAVHCLRGSKLLQYSLATDV